MKTFILILSALLLIFSCGKKCKEEASKKSYLDPELEAYFGVFKKGNYWVYENQDKTKRDSIYVTASDRKFILDVTACDDFETLEFTLKEKEKDIVHRDSVCIQATRSNINTQNCEASSFFSGNLQVINFYKDTILASNFEVEKFQILSINGQQYFGSIIRLSDKDTLYMQQDIGIIGWKKNNDTYNLVKKYLQP